MSRLVSGVFVLLVFASYHSQAQTKYSVKWEELRAADFRAAISRAQGTCLLPLEFWKNIGRSFRRAPTIKRKVLGSARC